MTHGASPGLSQSVMAIYVCFWSCLQCEYVRQIDLGGLSVCEQSIDVSQVQDMRFSWHTRFQRPFHCAQDVFLIVLKDQ
ncbi:hypothetical protein [Tritonibacter scottomollicae]|uniref:Uncharacterized protein n=1 Tax=Tritonibacter scottomollicae TaxID=483013 RepID=A0A2T1AE59_TRISK|nr:hypothetical protein [Tritonibacter scottomollicae]PRZ46861.1 hypothetical protein CLV89_1085 [Tritonibacter scottomollicae]